ETALSVSDTAMRVCGGAAFSKHLGIERAFRDARAGYVMAPTSDVLYEFLGRALCGLELF
ncbi:MAG: acyl-CoA/acyl-ACP dehydrogenase, partial [Geodermatophilaceae bacterium]|nr:acyl-CoA/acyl-ACP dehydrogenase [Geodermatophilaceae bacterium]